MWAEQAARHLAIFYDCHLDEKRASSVWCKFGLKHVTFKMF